MFATGGLIFASSLGVSPGMEIQIDYTLDTHGFFDQPGSRAALRAVCDYFEGAFGDSLARIDPSEWPGNTWTAKVVNPATGSDASFPRKVVPADTFILYAGGRPNLGSAGEGGPAFYSASGSGPMALRWFDLLDSRGQAGALATPPTDFGPWGGSISFNSSHAWNFSLTTPSGTAANNFVSLAIHEMCHVLGMGTTDSWDTFVGFAGGGLGFTGQNATAAYGGMIPLHIDGSHWRDDGVCVFGTGYVSGNPLNILSKTIAQFGVPAGIDQIAIMDPSSCNTGSYLEVMTVLDRAALADIGWESRPPPAKAPSLALGVHPGSGHVTLSWKAEPGRTYQIQEASVLGGWRNLGDPVTNQSGTASYTHHSPPKTGNFYRVVVDPPEASPAVSAAASPPPQVEDEDSTSFGEIQTVQTQPRMVFGCATCAGHQSH
ncbi:hypothetical protein BH23VER1_BH23VER1_14130 [soil metagenome]